MHRRAFTLVELTMVLLILAVLAGAVTLRVQGPLATARMDEAVGILSDFDRGSRLTARQQGRPLRIAIDLTAGRLAQTDTEAHELGPTARLPEAFTIQRVLVRGQDIREGGVALSCSRLGLTPTYAVLLTGRGLSQWLVVFGLSGQQIKVDSEDQAREILSQTGVRNDVG